jgi:protein O-GlcNAc transferase
MIYFKKYLKIYKKMKIQNNPNQLFMMASQAHQQGQLVQAENLYRQVLQHDPNHIDTHHLLGLVCSQQNKHYEAIQYLQKATFLNPGNPIFHNNLAEALRRKGDDLAALESFNQALKIAPDFAEAHFNLANVLKNLNRINDAKFHYEQAIKYNPRHIRAYYNLGNTLREQGMFRSAIETYKKAIEINNNYPEAHNNLGTALREFDENDEALKHYQFALELKPDFIEAHRNIAIAFETQGKMSEAIQHYRIIQASEPDNHIFNLHIDSIASIIPASNEEIDSYRENLLKSIEKLSTINFKIDLSKINESGGQPSSMLIYQGRDDKLLKIKYGELFAGKFPVREGLDRFGIQSEIPNQAIPLPQTNMLIDMMDEEPPAISLPRHSNKPHVGFVVTYGHEGVFIKCMRGILNNLSGEQFRITVVCSFPNGKKIIRPTIDNPAVEYLNLPPRFEQAVETVRNANFDILNYWEVGTDVTNYFLPYFGLAQVQLTSWGWPVTTGIPQMNYFVSSELLEIEEADSHYTEKLVRLKHLPVYYYRPPVPENLKSRRHFGLDENDHVYICTQNLRKVHPTFDRLTAEVLRRDPQGILLFINDKQENITQQLKNRLQKNHPDIMPRVRFMERLPEVEYLNLVVRCDVILDTLYYTGGANTTYDAFACGTPVVTLPTQFHRGRYTTAAYKQIDILDCIAENEEDYINIAVKLGTDPEYRKVIKDRITANCPVLFEDKAAVDELAEFFQKALNNQL